MELLTTEEIETLTSLTRSGIWYLEGKGRFPRRIKIGERRVAWIKSEIEDWIASRERGGPKAAASTPEAANAGA